MHQVKKSEARQMISNETKEKLDLSVSAKEMLEKTEAMYQRIENLKEQKRELAKQE